ncbi:hypothetical protein WN943_001673 [Citrus x changshan-huyou]
MQKDSTENWRKLSLKIELRFSLDAFAKCPPLCLTLKVFLQHRELNDEYSGGIGSYALLTMIMAVLKSSYESEYSRFIPVPLRHNQAACSSLKVCLYEGQASPEHNLGILLVCAGLNCYVHGYVVLPVGAVTYIFKPA